MIFRGFRRCFPALISIRISADVCIFCSFTFYQCNSCGRADAGSDACICLYQPVDHIVCRFQDICGKIAVLTDTVAVIEGSAGISADQSTVIRIKSKLLIRPLFAADIYDLLVQLKFRIIDQSLVSLTIPCSFIFYYIFFDLKLGPVFFIDHICSLGGHRPFPFFQGFFRHMIIRTHLVFGEPFRQVLFRRIIPVQIFSLFRLQIQVFLPLRLADFHCRIFFSLAQSFKGHPAYGIGLLDLHKLINLIVAVPVVKGDHCSRKFVCFIGELVFPDIIISLLHIKVHLRFIDQGDLLSVKSCDQGPRRELEFYFLLCGGVAFRSCDFFNGIGNRLAAVVVNRKICKSYKSGFPGADSLCHLVLSVENTDGCSLQLYVGILGSIHGGIYLFHPDCPVLGIVDDRAQSLEAGLVFNSIGAKVKRTVRACFMIIVVI